MSDSKSTTPPSSGAGATATPSGTAQPCPTIENISVTVKATPPNTARTGIAAPANHVFDCAETNEAFSAASSLVLIRGDMQEVELLATVRPADAPVWWDVRRAPDDHANVGSATDLPAIIVDNSAPNKARLRPNQRGSFFVRAFVDNDHSHRFSAGSSFRLVPTVLVDVALNADNTVVSNAGLSPRISPAGFAFNTGSFNINGVRAGVASAAIYMNATVDVTSGGADGRRLLDCVFAGWINNLRSTIRLGRYAGGHVLQLVLATNRSAVAASLGGFPAFNPGDPAPTAPAMPILDTGRNPHGTGGETATLTSSRAPNADKVDQAVGQRWRVEAVDSPGGGQAGSHPNFPGALNRVHHEDNFTAFLGFWTNRSQAAGATADPANRVYAVLRTYQWSVLGEWTVGASAAGPTLTATTAPNVTTSAASTLASATEAHRAHCEVTAPNIFDLLAFDART